MKILFWIYAVVGTLYFGMHSAGVSVVVQYAVGPLWLMMMAAPVVLFVLIALSIARRLGFLGEST
jgi:hypothetical protein